MFCASDFPIAHQVKGIWRFIQAIYELLTKKFVASAKITKKSMGGERARLVNYANAVTRNAYKGVDRVVDFDLGRDKGMQESGL